MTDLIPSGSATERKNKQSENWFTIRCPKDHVPQLGHYKDHIGKIKMVT